MTRREALKRIGFLMGGTLIVAEPFLTGTRLMGKTSTVSFSKNDLALIDEIGETIIPATNSPGAKAANVSACIVVLVNDCYDDAHQALFESGLKKIDQASEQRFGKGFRDATPEQRTQLLNDLDREQREFQRTKAKEQLPHYFRAIKELVLVSYFTSEIGATQALRYVEVPGRFDGNLPYKKGDRAFFTGPSRNFS